MAELTIEELKTTNQPCLRNSIFWKSALALLSATCVENSEGMKSKATDGVRVSAQG